MMTQMGGAATAASASPPRLAGESWRLRSLRRSILVRRLNARAYVGLTLFGLALVAALLAPWLAPHDPELADITRRLLPPAWAADG